MTDFSDCLKAKSFMPASRSRALKSANLLSFKTVFYPSLKIREDSCPSFRLRQKVPGSVMFQQCPVHSGEGLEGPTRRPGAAGSEGTARVPWGRGTSWTERGHGRARATGTLGLKRRQGKDGHARFSRHQWHCYMKVDCLILLCSPGRLVNMNLVFVSAQMV